MAYTTYSSYAGSLRPESSLPTIDEGSSHDLTAAAASPPQPPEPMPLSHRSPRYSGISINLLPPGHQSPSASSAARFPSAASSSSPSPSPSPLPATRVPSHSHSTISISSASHSNGIAASGLPSRPRHGTAGSSGTTVSLLSLDESELFRGAQDALAHLDDERGEESSQQQSRAHDEPTATSIALSQHYRYAGQVTCIEDENLTGISQMTKTPMALSRVRPPIATTSYSASHLPGSPSLPSSLQIAAAAQPTATPRSKSVTFAAQSPERIQDRSQTADDSVPDDLTSSEREVLSNYTREPPSESSPPSSRSQSRVSPRQTSVALPSVSGRHPHEQERAGATSPAPTAPDSPSPSPRSTHSSPQYPRLGHGSPHARSSTSPHAHTSVARTPSRLRNVLTLTDTESSVESVAQVGSAAAAAEEPSFDEEENEEDGPVWPLRRSLQQALQRSRDGQSTPPPPSSHGMRISISTPSSKAASPHGSPAALAPSSSSSSALKVVTPRPALAPSSPNVLTSTPLSARSAGTGTFGTAESFQSTPLGVRSQRTLASGSPSGNNSGSSSVTKGADAGTRQGRPTYPSLFAQTPEDDEHDDDKEDDAPAQRSARLESLSQSEAAPAPVPVAAEDSLSRLTRAAQAISSATAGVFAHLGQSTRRPKGERSEPPSAAAGEQDAARADAASDPSRSAAEAEADDAANGADLSVGAQEVQELARGADLVREMHELHAALQANLLQRLHAAEREHARERDERVGLERRVRALVLGLMDAGAGAGAAVDATIGEETDASVVLEEGSTRALLRRFRSWALDALSSSENEAEAEAEAERADASVGRSTAADDSARVRERVLQAELERLEDEVAHAEANARAAQSRAAELEAERDELRDEQGVFQLELANARREREEAADELEQVREAQEDALRTRVAEERAACLREAEADRRRLEADFAAREKALRREAEEEAQRAFLRLEGERRVAEAERASREAAREREMAAREEEIARLAAEVEKERARRVAADERSLELRAQLQAATDEVSARAGRSSSVEAAAEAELRAAREKVKWQAARIKELEQQSATSELEIAKILRALDKEKVENANLVMGLSAKQQELSLLKRNGPRMSGANTTAAATPRALKTPRASERYSRPSIGSTQELPTTARRRPPTAVLQSLILNTETPLPSSRIASRSTIGKAGLGSGLKAGAGAGAKRKTGPDYGTASGSESENKPPARTGTGLRAYATESESAPSEVGEEDGVPPSLPPSSVRRPLRAPPVRRSFGSSVGSNSSARSRTTTATTTAAASASSGAAGQRTSALRRSAGVDGASVGLRNSASRMAALA